MSILSAPLRSAPLRTAPLATLLLHSTTSAALAAGLVFGAAAFDGTSADASASALVVKAGPLFGSWDLPADPSTPGSASGRLNEAPGVTTFTLDAELLETATPALAFRIETIAGDLDDGSGFAYPDYGLTGDWVATSLTGVGSFDAFVTRQVSPLGPVFLVGKAGGAFRDLPAAQGPGAFTGRWQADVF